MRRKEVRTNELTNIRTDEQNDENYIPVGINAWGLMKCVYSLEVLLSVVTICILSKKMKNKTNFHLKIVISAAVKNAVHVY